MPTAKIILLTINILGGLAVIGSYILGLGPKGSGANALWGGTPVSIRTIYTISMVIAALGYLAFIYYLLFKLNDLSIFNYLYFIFLGILLPSIFWMPLTSLFIVNSSPLIWFAVRLVLIIVGISSCILVWTLFNLHVKESGIFYWLAVIGSMYFAFHTAILDMILWPIFFKK